MVKDVSAIAMTGDAMLSEVAIAIDASEAQRELERSTAGSLCFGM